MQTPLVGFENRPVLFLRTESACHQPCELLRMIRDRKRWTNLQRDDQVVIYPTYGCLDRDRRTWRVELCGTVYESGSVSLRNRLMVRLLQRVARVTPTELEQPTFQERIREFVAPTGGKKRLVVMLGDHVYPLRKATKRNGRFQGVLRIPAEALGDQPAAAKGWLDLHVLTPFGEISGYTGRVRLLEPQGISVISDIDDTLKVTEVHCRRSLLTNTFLREFRAVEGMADLYRTWAEQQVDFHYVSSSPWQLYRPLQELFAQERYPSGTFHLRSFRLHHHMLRRLLLIRRRGKTATMHSLLRAFPQRKFILVGDSSEMDAEIYASLARRYPKQVLGIYIREVAARPLEPDRQRKLCRRLEAGQFQVFRDAAELPRQLPWGIPPR